MAINFSNIIPNWENSGTPPSEDLKKGGFRPGYKPPAAVFNWFWSLVSKCILELQSSLSDVSDRGLVYDAERFTVSLSGGGGSSGEGGGSYVLPVATRSRLGGVIIGEGIDVLENGEISADYEAVAGMVAEAAEDITADEVKDIFKNI